jgi:hypothetical protein
MSMSTHFEERLLQQLRQVVADRPAAAHAVTAAPAPPRMRRRRLVLAGAGGVAAVAAAVAIVAGSGGVTDSAYAVIPRADGSVTVKISTLSDADGLQGALRAAGVPAVVRYGRATDCPGPVTGPAPGPGSESGNAQHHTAAGDASGPSTDTAGAAPAAGAGNPHKVTGAVRTDADGTTFTIDPGPLAPGDKVYITASGGTTQSLGVRIGQDATAACAPAPSGG